MRKIQALLLSVLLLSVPSRAQTKSEPRQESLVFTHITVIDATGSPAKPDTTVVIDGERIVAIGQTGRVGIPRNARIVDGAGKFLIPGLWDMHVHIFNQISRRPPNAWYFPLFIANGVTSVRDMWTKTQDMIQVFEWRRQFAGGTLTAPRIAAVGILVNGPQSVLPNSDRVVTPEEARRMVRKIKSAGADFVKTYSSLSPEAYLAIANEARKQNIPFSGHVPFALGADEASNAGQGSMEHLNQVLETCSTKERELLRVPGKDWSIAYDKLMVDTYDESKCLKLLSLFAKNHTWQVPTLIRQQMHYFNGDLRYFTGSSRLKYIPIDEQEMWAPYITSQKSLSEDEKNSRKTVWHAYVALVASMHNANVEFMAGTDVGTEYIYPGFSLHDELELLVEAGLSPMEALRAATRNPAKFLGMLDRLGTVERGKLADLVLLDANPLEQISNTRRIYAVVLNGKFLPKKSLEKMLASSSASGR